jgi:pyruvate,orthophosphate dikinase
VRQFLPNYIESGILPDNPFEMLDVDGVGRLMQLAVEWGREARPASSSASVASMAGNRRQSAFATTPGSIRLVLGAARAHRAARGRTRGAEGARIDVKRGA